MSTENIVETLQISLKNAYLLTVNDDDIKYIIQKSHIEYICPLGWRGKCLDVTKCIYCEKMLENMPLSLRKKWNEYNGKRESSEPSVGTSMGTSENKFTFYQNKITQNIDPTISPAQIQQDATIFMNKNYYPGYKKYTSMDDFYGIKEKIVQHVEDKFQEYKKYRDYIREKEIEICITEGIRGKLDANNQSHFKIINQINFDACKYLPRHVSKYLYEFSQNIEEIKKTFVELSKNIEEKTHVEFSKNNEVKKTYYY
jgi:hypothetical protein